MLSVEFERTAFDKPYARIDTKLMSSDSFSVQEFTEFRDLLQKISGIDLAQNKQYLVASRVRKILTQKKCDSLRDLTSLIRRPTELGLRQSVIDAMTTNETFWFRDVYPYDNLKKKILPSLVNATPSPRIRIWSAACSSGQEPYSIAMIAEEMKQEMVIKKPFALEVLATDLSNTILQEARDGTYDRLSISRGMSPERLSAHFDPVGTDQWQVKSALKRNVRFQALNLLESYSSLGQFDVIFCRNVLIYFSAEHKKDIITRLQLALKPGGRLVLGASEGLADARDLFTMESCKPGVVFIPKRL